MKEDAKEEEDVKDANEEIIEIKGSDTESVKSESGDCSMEVFPFQKKQVAIVDFESKLLALTHSQMIVSKRKTKKVFGPRCFSKLNSLLTHPAVGSSSSPSPTTCESDATCVLIA